jgi:hypothetical protein
LQPIRKSLDHRRLAHKACGIDTEPLSKRQELENQLLAGCKLCLDQFLPVLAFFEPGQFGGRPYRILKRTDLVDEPVLQRLDAGPDLTLANQVHGMFFHIAPVRNA